MGQVLPLRATQADLEEAWRCYDEARVRLEAMYADDSTTSQQRFEAALTANRLHRQFYQTWKRTEAAA
jgi:hypothetical protein